MSKSAIRPLICFIFIICQSVIVVSCSKTALEINLSDTYWIPVYAKGQDDKKDSDTRWEGTVDREGNLYTTYFKNGNAISVTRHYMGFHFFLSGTETVFYRFEPDNSGLKDLQRRYFLKKSKIYLETLKTDIEDLFSSSSIMSSSVLTGEYEEFTLRDVTDDSMTIDNVTYRKTLIYN